MNRHDRPASSSPENDRSHPVRSARDLDNDESWDVLANGSIGHLALRDAGDGVDVFPVNYLAHGGRLYFRSAPGTKLQDAHAAPSGALLVEDVYRSRRATVLVKGRVERIEDDEEIVRSGVLDLLTYAPGEKTNFMRITPLSVHGRFFRLDSDPEAPAGSPTT